MTLYRLSATDMAAKIASGEVSSEALIRACLARIDEREAGVHAWAAIDREGAISAGREADKARLLSAGKLGPLHGVPFAVKDIISTAELPTEYNSAIYRGHRPGSDAPVVMTLRAAGAVVLGKTETVEFAAHGRNPVTRNPHDFARTPGGSSAGSAAAVADLMVPLALGTQTGGSVIRPGAYCGCIGFKPTYGTVSTEGVKLFSSTLDTVGWYARTVADIRLVAGILEIADDQFPQAPAPSSLRIGVCRTPYWDRALPATRGAIEEAARRFAKAGAKVEDAELDPAFADYNELKEIVMRAEGRFAFLNLQRAYPEKLSPGIRKRMDRIPNRKLREALDKAASLRPVFDRFAGGYDAILTPSTTGEAPIGLESTGDPIFNGMWTLLHAPCLTLPGLTGPEGLPVGVQLVGPRYADGALLAVAETTASLLQA